MTTDLQFRSDQQRKRPLVGVDTLLNLKSLISENLSLNNNANECRFPVVHSDEIEAKKRKEGRMFANRSVSVEDSTKSDPIKATPRRVITLKEYTERRNLQLANTTDTTLKRIVIPSTKVHEEGEVLDSDEDGSMGTSELPTLSDIQLPPIHIDQECLARIRQIILSGQTYSKELQPTRKSFLATLGLSNDTENGHRSNSSTTTISSVAAFSLRQQHSKFEFVRTATSEDHAFIPSEVLDCCQYNRQPSSLTSNENNADYYDNLHSSLSLRETMIQISERLIKAGSIPIVDTHCHFDLIFDRLSIQHHDLKQYFHDYQDFYPAGFSFQLAIHVFWRPRHLTKINWISRYSKYLRDDRVYGACGIHPHWSSVWKETSVRDIERCLQHPKVVALGEIGLDFGPKNTVDVEQQCRVFVEQLKLAAKWSKPVVIHSRNAYELTFDIMKQFLTPAHRIHLHCFVGTFEDVQLFTSYFTDIKFGFTPVISRTKSLHAVIEQLDLRQILSETDSPYFVPAELAEFTRCAHPGMVYSVVEVVAQVRQLSIEQVAHRLRENARQMYGV